MAMMTFLKNRRSVRDFEDGTLDTDDISNIQNAIEEIEEEFVWNDIKLELIEDGERIYKELEGKAGYAGVMIKSPGYIAVRYSNRDNLTYLKGAFVMGELVSRLVSFGVDSCIITLGDNINAAKNKLFGLEGVNTDYIVAIGYAKSKPPFKPEVTSYRKPIEELVFLDKEFNKPANDKLKTMNLLDLFSAIKYSPSYKNKQPWRFVVTDEDVVAYVKNDEELRYSMTDMGIIMYYFQEMIKSMGVKGNWEIVKDLDSMGEYIKLGRYKI